MKLFADISNKYVIYLKGFLFLLAGILAFGIIFLENRNFKTAILLIIAIWAFCRFYYFLFYVIEKYVDEKFKFSGIISALRYLLKR